MIKFTLALRVGFMSVRAASTASKPTVGNSQGRCERKCQCKMDPGFQDGSDLRRQNSRVKSISKDRADRCSAIICHEQADPLLIAASCQCNSLNIDHDI